MCTELAQSGTRSYWCHLHSQTIRLVITTISHACNATTNSYVYRHSNETTTILLTHYRSSVSYNQHGSDIKCCGTRAQSNRFTLHIQPRDQVFWQHTTTWYRNNRFIDTSGVHGSDITSRFEAKRHTRCCWTICTLLNEHGWGLDHTKLRDSGRKS